jgi:hypothetical protein
MRILWENIVIPIKVGDTVLGGKFKNKRIVVKSIDKNEKGDITINGRPFMKFRLLPSVEESIIEGRPIPMDSPNEFVYLDFKKYAYKNRKMFKKELIKHSGDGGKMFLTLSALWYKWARKNAKEYTHIKNGNKFGRDLMIMMVKDDLIFDKKAWKKTNKITGLKETIMADKIECSNCGWTWMIKDGGDDLYICHKCGHDNQPHQTTSKDYKRLNIGEEAQKFDFDKAAEEMVTYAIKKYKAKNFKDFMKVLKNHSMVGLHPSLHPMYKSFWDKYSNSNESIEEETKRDYKKEYAKYGKSKKAKKYRAELNKYNRDKGTYGNGDGKDASHKGGKIVGFEDESKNRGRAEKSRLKKEDSPESAHPQGSKKLSNRTTVMDMLDVISHKEFGPDYHKLSNSQKKKVLKVAKEQKFITEIYYDNQGNPCKYPTTLDGRCLDKNHPSHKREPLSEIPMGDLKQIDTFADKKLNPVDVVLTDKHFFDRLNDPRNDKEISKAELIGFFKRLSKKKKEFLSFLDTYKQVVAVDDRTNINIPFMKQANKVIAKTVMRKKDFKTQNQKVSI